MALPPDEKEAKKHWLAQEAPLGRPFNTRDPGLTAVSGPEDIQAIITREVQGEQVPTYRQRTSQNLPDPVARTQGLIRQHNVGKISSDKFITQCESVEDMALYLALYGDMEDDKKAAIFVKLSKLLADKQREAQKQNNIDRAREDRQIKNTLANQDRLKKLLAAGVFEGQVIDAKPTGEAQ